MNVVNYFSVDENESKNILRIDTEAVSGRTLRHNQFSPVRRICARLESLPAFLCGLFFGVSGMARQQGDIIGRRFTRLVVLGRIGWANCLVRCDCGTVKVVRVDNLQTRNTVSCGCANLERVRAPRKGPRLRATMPEYAVWVGMHQRCSNPRREGYHNYGGRGIKVCCRWKEYEAFIEDMGRRPSPQHSLNRKDNDGNYEPGNVEWALAKQQARNTRANTWLEMDGLRCTLVEWAERLGINATTISARLKYGWSVKRALSTPVRKNKP